MYAVRDVGLSLGGSSPLCAITGITNNMRCTSQKQIYYGVQGQVNDNIFRWFIPVVRTYKY